MNSNTLDLKSNVKIGIYSGLVVLLISVMGIVETFADRMLINPGLSMGNLLLILLFFGTGYLAGSPPPIVEGSPEQEKGSKNIIAGLTTGFVSSLFLVLLVVAANAFDLRSTFLNISPPLTEILTFGQSGLTGLLLIVVFAVILGGLGGGLHLLSDKWKKPLIMSLTWVILLSVLEDVVSQILRSIGLAILQSFLYEGLGGFSLLTAVILFLIIFGIYYWANLRKESKTPSILEERTPEQKRRKNYINLGLVALFMLVLPFILGSANTEVLDKVGLALLMGLGLNIVIGFAGLLDLGYVAFFAVGAYATTVLTSPSSPKFTPELTFWMALPIVILVAVIAGLFVGAPVLRMRGDYLAIVTLGFGEIARILAKSEWFTPILGGAQGILSVPDIKVGSLSLNSPQEIYYPILGFSLLAAYISIRLQDSRVGRAWMAMREDEPVAEIMGVNIVTAKLLAFITGAVLASFSGALFAAKIGSVFPTSFNILVSITILVLIIVGGMGSIPGVVIGALVIVGVPELLKEFDAYREFFYGVLLVVMMRIKPEGLIPSTRFSRELHEDEKAQDAWLKSEEAVSTSSSD